MGQTSVPVYPPTLTKSSLLTPYADEMAMVADEGRCFQPEYRPTFRRWKIRSCGVAEGRWKRRPKTWILWKRRVCATRCFAVQQELENMKRK